MRYAFVPRGVCSSRIEFDLDGGVIRNVEFTRGCSGNTQGVGALCQGMRAEEIIKRLEGINCGGKGTSCPDQLAKAVRAAMEQEAEKM